MSNNFIKKEPNNFFYFAQKIAKYVGLCEIVYNNADDFLLNSYTTSYCMQNK